ncbi:MAG: hypothetical protein H7196_03810 [candidate division SR1 bacterium]|nr:hypothetical protein [candidate division SR1 bacterium]
MSKFIFKPFVVMVLAFFVMIFLVSTTISLPTFAVNFDFAHIIVVDNTSTKDLNLCVNNKFVSLNNNEYSVNPGKTDIKVFFGKAELGVNCDNPYNQFKKVFEVNPDIGPDEIFTITASGKADLTAVINHNKTVLIKETEILNMQEPTSIISWKGIDKSSVKNKNEICLNNKVVMEDKVNSREITVRPGFYNISFEYDQSGDICNPVLPQSEDHTLELNIGCECDKKYEITVQRDDDYSKARYQGLSFNTQITEKKIETLIPPVKLIPVISKPIPPPATKIIPSMTVRSGGGNNLFMIISFLSITIVSACFISKRKTIKWS